MSVLFRFPVGDIVVHKTNPHVTWVVTKADREAKLYECSTVQSIQGQPLVHAYTFHENELDRGFPK